MNCCEKFTAVKEAPFLNEFNETGYAKPKNRTFQSLFETTGAGTVIIEKDMTISMANLTFERLTGYDRREIQNRMKFTALLHPDEVEQIKGYHVNRRKCGNIPPTYECRIVTRLNEIRHVVLEAAIIPETGKSIISIIDISDRICIEKALCQSIKQQLNLLENLPGMAYRRCNDAHFSMAFMSDGCSALTGYSRCSLICEKENGYHELIHPEDRDRIRQRIAKALMNKEPFRIHYRIRTASGQEKWVWDQGIGIFSETGDLLSIDGYISDFTMFKKIENIYKQRHQVLQGENTRLRSYIKECCGRGFCGIIGVSKAMREVYELILKTADIDDNVVIHGESGTGKELVARAVHEQSRYRNGNFVVVNCGAIPQSIIESEFFGYKKGAFTNAGQDKPGYLDAAAGGTLFLDELEEMSLNMQVKMLRAIEGRGYTPVGDTRVKQSNCRIVTATNKNLNDLVHAGTMREDFYFRINIIPIHVPPLRDRKEDIPLLVDYFMKQHGNGDEPKIDDAMFQQLMAYGWPGNVRELENAIHRYVTLGEMDFMKQGGSTGVSGTCNSEIVVQESASDDFKPLYNAVQDFEKQYIFKLMDKYRWHKSRVAEILGIDRRTLYRKLKAFGLA
ncbi:MAG: sigma 54-interacting transcriptional regulator [Desulfobacterales bacterium]|nr:sigma 54-interacting transcriptional regulator [Desulfobacterales bacterium]MDD4073012.1 sigma 54-interacting transcriptional regulator [Desulfobacterales bacterium]MDD4391502.1 sigma 54-interacting transcriptional regulator [Desulfobacterales bacterium]